MSDTPKWADDIAERVMAYLHDLEYDEWASEKTIAGIIADHMEEYDPAMAYFEWLFTNLNHTAWQAHQLSKWVKMNRDSVPEAILKIAEAKP